MSALIAGSFSKMMTIGIDNGTSGSWAAISENISSFNYMPTKVSILGKKERRISRIDFKVLCDYLSMYCPAKAYLERPFTGRFLNAVLPAQRAFEAVLIALEHCAIPYEVIDSKTWQKPLLGDIKGSANLKEASLSLGCKLYPYLSDAIRKHGDADGLLIAHYFAKVAKQ